MAKLPKLQYVKFTRSKGKLYAYFNTGRTANGKTVHAALPPFGSVGFYDSYAAMLGARNKRETMVYTVEHLAAAYEASMDFKGKARATQNIYSSTIRRIVDLFGDFPVHDLQRSDIREALEKDITTNGSRNIFLSVIGVLYAFARDQEITTGNVNPAAGFKAFKMGEHEPWPDDLLQASLTCDNDRVRLAVHLLYYTGQRIGDVVKMRWSDIRDGVLIVTPQKTARYRKVLRIPLHSALEAELDATPRAGITIITGRMGKPITQRPLRESLQDFAADMGFEVVPHGLRKNSVNSLLEAGCTPHEVAAITGQSFQMIEHYARRVSQHKLGEAAIFKLEQTGAVQTRLQTASKDQGNRA